MKKNIIPFVLAMLIAGGAMAQLPSALSARKTFYCEKGTINAITQDETIPEINILNPMPGCVFIESLNDAMIGSVEIYNIQGGMVASLEAQSPEVRVELPGLTRGIYIIRLNIGPRLLSRKVFLN